MTDSREGRVGGVGGVGGGWRREGDEIENSSGRCDGETNKKKKILLNKKSMIAKELERCHQLRERPADANNKEKKKNTQQGGRGTKGAKCLRVMYEKSGEEEIY